MGSQIDDADEVKVLVTGFGPFRTEYPRNPSWEITSRLPEYLPPYRAKDASGRYQSPAIPRVRIMAYPEPIGVTYENVRALVPRLWDENISGVKYDIAIHIGMAGPRQQYQIERRGHRDGYFVPDLDNKLLGDQDEFKNHKEGWYWEGLPSELETEFNIDDILKRWRSHCPDDATLLISNDAGSYLCDFIYYSSLALLYKEGRPRKVLFLHVPADANDVTIPRGRDYTLNLIRSVVESEVAGKQGRLRAEEAEPSAFSEPHDEVFDEVKHGIGSGRSVDNM